MSQDRTKKNFHTVEIMQDQNFLKVFSIVYVKLLNYYVSFLLRNLSKVHLKIWRNTARHINCIVRHFAQMNEKSPVNMNKITSWEIPWSQLKWRKNFRTILYVNQFACKRYLDYITTSLSISFVLKVNQYSTMSWEFVIYESINFDISYHP